jgi:hypothetical protein
MHDPRYAAGCQCGDRCAEVGAAHPGEFTSEFGCAGGMNSFAAPPPPPPTHTSPPIAGGPAKFFMFQKQL